MYLSRLLLAIFFFGAIGVGVELLLIEHFEDFQQLIPLGLIVVSLAAAAWYASAPGAASLRAFRVVMATMAASGVLGQYLHLRGNMEFETERDPAIAGFRLFRESMMGATPAMAPGTMVLLALIGYAYSVSRNRDGAVPPVE